MRYLILASPRSGSTLVGRVLHATGMAGDPLEFFSPYVLNDERKRRGNEDLTYNELIKLAERESKEAGDAFGIHLHLSQFIDAYGKKGILNKDMEDFLKSFDKIIWTRRRNRIRQAISWAVARRTRAFTSEEKAKPFSGNEITATEIINALKLISVNDSGWKEIILRLQLPHIQVWYEDVVQDYYGSFQKILNHLEINDKVSEIPEPPIQKQATQINDRLAARFAAYLGVRGGQI